MIPKNIKIAIWVIITLIVVSFTNKLYTGITGFYNSEKQLTLQYKELEQLQITTFDNNYLAFKEKFDIADINRNSFVTVTEIIMEGRSDGKQVAWKWLQENQPIDYNVFSKFYADLSSFTQARYTQNAEIEKSKQQIAKNHNLLIKTFPGIWYNYIFKFQQLEYKEGFISQDTKSLFNK